MEPLRSANRTVTCLRSPCRAAFDVRIFSARCFGVYDCGEVKPAVAIAPIADPVGCAHCGQNLAVGESCRPHLEHAWVSTAEHSSQNFASASFSCWHLGHLIKVAGAEK